MRAVKWAGSVLVTGISAAALLLSGVGAASADPIAEVEDINTDIDVNVVDLVDVGDVQVIDDVTVGDVASNIVAPITVVVGLID